MSVCYLSVRACVLECVLLPPLLMQFCCLFAPVLGVLKWLFRVCVCVCKIWDVSAEALRIE